MSNFQKIKFRSGMRSSYLRDFSETQSSRRSSKKDSLNDLAPCDQRTYMIPPEFKSQVDFQSTSRQEFVQKQASEKNPRFRNKQVEVDEEARLGKSQYHMNFMNWAQKDVYRPNVKYTKNIIEDLPNFKRTSYKDDFGNFYASKADMKNHKNTFQSLKPGDFCTNIIPNLENNTMMSTTGIDFGKPQNHKYNIPKRNIK